MYLYNHRKAKTLLKRLSAPLIMRQFAQRRLTLNLMIIKRKINILNTEVRKKSKIINSNQMRMKTLKALKSDPLKVTRRMELKGRKF